MATKKFIEDEVLIRAMELFWKKGYEATSMRDLVGHLKITTGSIYDTFGSKRELYSKALAKYNELYIQQLVACLGSNEDGRKSIELFFNIMIGNYSSPKGCQGCLLTNSVTELAMHDKGIAKQSALIMDSIEEAFLNAVKRGQKLGTISKKNNAKDLASLFANVFMGMNASVKVKQDTQSLKRTIKSLMTTLN